MAEMLTTAPSSPAPAKWSTPQVGLSFQRHFTCAGVHPFDEVTWELRDAVIQDFKGNLIFEQKNVEVPSDWSMTATNIVASKYLHGRVGTPERETGVRQLITRVAESIRDWGIRDRYFASAEDADIFFHELTYLLVHQRVAFNSPVWFNVGCDRLEPNSDAQNWHWDALSGQSVFSRTGYSRPQCSACFINSVEDSLDSILTLAKTEGMLFKWGSGAGSNLSKLRGSMETLSGGGTASGPLSFMRGFDAFAGVIKSGGKTRRAAKMVVLNVDHPDIEEFIQCKVVEERKAWTLMAAGYDGSGPDSEAFTSIFFQNANNSVRVTDEFMNAVVNDGTFFTRAVKDGSPVKEYRARDLMHSLAEATWQCGDPGMQYDTTINRWHTSKNTDRINASNPCSEYMFLDDSACNLASFNLMKFLTPGGQFDVASYRHAIGIVTTAMEIIVDAAGYPTERISRNSHDYRPLGLGYANLGALLMDRGLPYDSDAGRAFAGSLTAILCGEAYAQSARIAECCPPLAAATPIAQAATVQGGACPGFYVNREPFLEVIRMHRDAVDNIDKNLKPARTGAPGPDSRTRDHAATDAAGFVAPQLDELKAASQHAWDEALVLGERFGFRNSQVTVLAPTGTIGFMMDCDTTGVEPDLALVKYKKLVGGGMIKIVNNTVPGALFKLGYRQAEVEAIVNYIDETGTIEGAPGIKPEHLAVFDCSFKPAKGTRSISWLGHVKMMAATQPFLSGAISKTVNLPNDCTVQDIADAYTEAWRLGLKAVAIYRDGSKGTQPLNVSVSDKDKKGEQADAAANLASRSAELASATSNTPTNLSSRPESASFADAVERPAVAPAQSPAEAGTTEIAEALAAQKNLTQAAVSQAQTAQLEAFAAQQKLAAAEARITQLLEAARTGAPGPASGTRDAAPAISGNTDNTDADAPPRAVRHRLPSERASITHKFGIAGHEGYITVGLYPNGQPGEIFIRMAKEGSTISGLMDSFATAASMCLQHGVPLKLLCEKFSHTRFEPSGWTGNEQIGYAKSIMDYLFRWMQLRFLSGTQLDLFAGMKPAPAIPAPNPGAPGPDFRTRDGSAHLQGADASVSPTQSTTTLSSRPESASFADAAERPAVAPTYNLEPTTPNPDPIVFTTPGQQSEVVIDRRATQPIAEELTASSGLSSRPERSEVERPASPTHTASPAAFHAADAMKSLYDMGDAPSCATCGAIMVRNGACHRCMECGSTSGCS